MSGRALRVSAFLESIVVRQTRKLGEQRRERALPFRFVDLDRHGEFALPGKLAEVDPGTCAHDAAHLDPPTNRPARVGKAG